MILELNVRVKYNANLVPENVLRSVLEEAAEHLVDNGLITGCTDAEASEVTHEVKRLD